MKSSPFGNELHFATHFLSKRKLFLALIAGLLLLSIHIGYSRSHVGAQSRKPFDLVSDSQDMNGLNFNPRWAWQESNAGAPDPNTMCFDSAGEFTGCTNDAVDFDEPEAYKILHNTCRITAETKVHGHVNWRATAYEAHVSWSEFSIDGDYCLELAPDKNNGLTANRPTLHVEFHAGETTAHFNTPWWKDFRKSVGIRNLGFGAGKKEREFVQKFVNGKRAVVIGLLNLDCVHKCYTELHPVYAIAINVKTEVRGDGDVDEVWAIFARNWGNEGWCSTNQHYLNLENNSNKLLLTLPWGPDTLAGKSALSFDVVNDGTTFLSNNQQASGPDLSLAENAKVLLSFALPKATDQARIHGELRLRWKMPKTAPGQPASAAPSPVSIASSQQQKEEVEEKPLFDLLDQEQRKKVDRENKTGTLDTIPVRVTVRSNNFGRFSIDDRAKAASNEVEPRRQPPRVESKYDAAKAERDKRLLGIPPN